jgi:o-succinylbenzoate---CoA ligase
MSDSIRLNDLVLSLADIQLGLYTPKDAWEYEVLNFCKMWLIGSETFEVQTSGSTGTPKKIALSRQAMQASATATIEYLGLNENNSALLCLNPAYIGGKMMLVRGIEHHLQMTIIPPAANPYRQLLSIYTRENIPFYDFIAFVPLQLETMLNESPDAIHWLSKSKAMIIGGASVNQALKLKIESINAPVYSTYGMTETVSHIALQRLNGKEKQDYFEILPRVNIKTDERQCLMIQTQMTNHEWLITNDLVEILNDKQFKWIGRIDQVVNSGGVKIQIEVVENTLEKIWIDEGISLSFFIGGLPDELLGEKLVVFIETSDRDLVNKIEKLLPLYKDELPKYWLPKEVISISQFIRTETAKIKRKDTIKRWLGDFLE